MQRQRGGAVGRDGERKEATPGPLHTAGQLCCLSVCLLAGEDARAESQEGLSNIPVELPQPLKSLLKYLFI